MRMLKCPECESNAVDAGPSKFDEAPIFECKNCGWTGEISEKGEMEDED